MIGSRVIVHGNLVFQNNSDEGGSLDGGALYVTSQGQVELTAGAQISFIDNTGMCVRPQSLFPVSIPLEA